MTADDTAELHKMNSFSLEKSDLKQILTTDKRKERRKDRILEMTKSSQSPLKNVCGLRGSNALESPVATKMKLYQMKSEQKIEFMKQDHQY